MSCVYLYVDMYRYMYIQTHSWNACRAVAEPAARLKGILDMQAQLLPIIRHMDRLLDAIATTCAGKVIIGGTLTVSHKRCFRAFGLEV